ncbi:MAG: hypothetical protein H0W54_05880 [Rubrobacter sp.]|nr:hypothetical protein [Rubrobacter sp.]
MPECGALVPLASSEYRRSIAEIDAPDAANRVLSAELLAFDEARRSRLLEETLRSITNYAALSGAILEMRAVRTARPIISSPQAVEELARDLWHAGLRVRFGRSWRPSPGADVCVGIGGDLERRLREHPAWRVVGPDL